MPEVHRKARPKELRAPLLTNPGKGCATFQRFNGDPLFPGEWWSEEGPLTFPAAHCDVVEHYLPTTVASCRWFWEKLEPREGEYHFEMIEGALKTAQARHQTLQVRLMGHGSEAQPRLPVWYREKYPTRRYSDFKSNYLEADHDCPEYLAKWGGLIREFGRRFDGHSDLESVDIAFVGRWGEGVGQVSDGTCETFIDLYREAFPRTPLLINCEGPQFRLGIARGLGWRADAFGDLRQSSVPEVPAHLGWNHTFDMYPRWIPFHAASETWRKRSITLETYSAPLEMQRLGWDFDFVLEQGLKFHPSIFVPKSTPLPEAWFEKLARFCDR
ncbi:MAG: beta-galactosidase, partial [Planctomycetota bacterium]